MPRRQNRLTVIVIPQTGKRTFSFQLATPWTAIIGVLLTALVAFAGVLIHKNRALKADMVELQELKRVNRLQQFEIDAMASKAQETQEQLGVLQRLDQQIRELTGQAAPAPASRGEAADTAGTVPRGRGGPQVARPVAANFPTLSSMIPQDVSAHLFAQRAPLIRNASTSPLQAQDPVNDLPRAAETNALMDAQLQDMDHLVDSLTHGKAAVADHLEYLAHRPSGFPVANAEFTDRFGWRWSPFGGGRQFHAGLDLAQDYWTPIVATGAGVVTHAGWRAGGYGNTVIIDHGYGFETLYGHMVDWDVKAGQEVTRGTRLGWLGSTGDSTGPHLHYEVHVGGVAVDPVKYLD